MMVDRETAVVVTALSPEPMLPAVIETYIAVKTTNGMNKCHLYFSSFSWTPSSDNRK